MTGTILAIVTGLMLGAMSVAVRLYADLKAAREHGLMMHVERAELRKEISNLRRLLKKFHQEASDN